MKHKENLETKELVYMVHIHESKIPIGFFHRQHGLKKYIE